MKKEMGLRPRAWVIGLVFLLLGAAALWVANQDTCSGSRYEVDLRVAESDLDFVTINGNRMETVRQFCIGDGEGCPMLFAVHNRSVNHVPALLIFESKDSGWRFEMNGVAVAPKEQAQRVELRPGNNQFLVYPDEVKPRLMDPPTTGLN